MKKQIVNSLLASVLIVIGGCQDDEIIEPVVPVEPGEEITFGSSLDDVQTRIVYDDEPNEGADGTKYYRVSWEDGDQIAIYCPEASQSKLVDYAITPDANDPTTSSAVTKTNADAAGLQWGDGDEHHFYGFYPASSVTGEENGKIRASIPTTQNVKEWNIQSNENGGRTFYGKTEADKYGYMWAYGKALRSDGNTDVALTFHPWMTVIEITIPGPTDGTTRYVSNVNIVATEGTETMLAGEFICDMTPVEQGATNPIYTPIEEGGEVNNTISISGFVPQGQRPSDYTSNEYFVKLGQNDKMVIRAYLLPIDEQHAIDARNITIAVSTLNGGTLRKTLGFSAVGPNSIQPHKVNRVTLPSIEGVSPNYWMSSLDRNIYLSELSIPGSKFSYLTAANNASPVYQGADINTQFKDGLRAFMAQLKANVTYNATRTGNFITGFDYSYDLVNATLPIEGGNSQTLLNLIEDVASGLQEAENELGEDRNLECAVLMLTYAGGGGVGVNFTGRPESGADANTVGGADNVWMDALEHVLTELTTNTSLDENVRNRIYTGEITANTTLDDVKGKIIFKINYNTDEQASHMSSEAQVPALFSRWMNTATQTTVPLYWGTPNQASAGLSWMYHEATHVGSDTEITWAKKQQEVLAVLQKSVDEYQNNDAHNTWFMVDAGGTYYEGSESNDNVIRLTEDLNPIVANALQLRTENASTGLVFFNFADKQPGSGQKYGTNNMIQTIIDNNFKFNLRKEGGASNP